MTDEDREELELDMRQEAYEEECYENKLRTDYDFFLSQQDIELFQELYWELKRQLSLHLLPFIKLLTAATERKNQLFYQQIIPLKI